MSDAMQSVICTGKFRKERMETSELKSLLKINCAVPISRGGCRWTQRATWEGLTLSTSSLPGRVYCQLWDPGWADYHQCSWVGGNSFLNLYKDVRKGCKRLLTVQPWMAAKRVNSCSLLPFLPPWEGREKEVGLVDWNRNRFNTTITKEGWYKAMPSRRSMCSQQWTLEGGHGQHGSSRENTEVGVGVRSRNRSGRPMG